MCMLGISGAAWVIDGGAEYLQTARWFGIRLWYIWIVYLVAIVLVTVLSGLNYFIRYRKLFL